MVLLAGAAAVATAQDPVETLRRTAETYRNLHGWEASGTLLARLPIAGESYTITWPLSVVQADGTLLPPDSPVPALSPLIRFGPQELRDAGGKVVTPSVTVPLSSPKGWPLWDQVDHGVRYIRELDSAVLEFEGTTVVCRVLEVSYEPGLPALALSEHAVRYWIDSSRYLVLRQSFTRRHPSQSGPIEWTFTAASLKLNEPPPAWALETLPQLAGDERSEWIGRAAPDFQLAALDGREIRLSALRGKAVLLSFWASWCAPCKEEMPLIERLAAEFEPKGLEVWGVTNESAVQAQAWLDHYGRHLRTLVDESRKVFADYEAEKIPVAVVVDRRGNVVCYRAGLSGEAQFRVAIEKALAAGGE
jgi:peroxiredoxin